MPEFSDISSPERSERIFEPLHRRRSERGLNGCYAFHLCPLEGRLRAIPRELRHIEGSIALLELQHIADDFDCIAIRAPRTCLSDEHCLDSSTSVSSPSPPLIPCLSVGATSTTSVGVSGRGRSCSSRSTASISERPATQRSRNLKFFDREISRLERQFSRLLSTLDDFGCNEHARLTNNVTEQARELRELMKSLTRKLEDLKDQSFREGFEDHKANEVKPAAEPHSVKLKSGEDVETTIPAGVV